MLYQWLSFAVVVLLMTGTESTRNMTCNKIKILVLHLVGCFVCIFIENDARNRDRNVLFKRNSGHVIL
jgi:hypothetical protein